MTEDLEHKLENIESLFTKLVDESFEYVITKLRDTYRGMDTPHKKALLLQLSEAGGIEIPVLGVAKEDTTNPYNPQMAIRIRIQEGVERRELATLLGYTKPDMRHYAENVIYVFEAGFRKPSPRARSELVKKYLGWLKEHGYNPFKL